jgi:hypothetical protein
MRTAEEDLLDLQENLGRSRAHARGVDAGMVVVYALLTGMVALLVWWWWK